jgi:hypothetical protein
MNKKRALTVAVKGSILIAGMVISVVTADEVGGKYIDGVFREKGETTEELMEEPTEE